MERKIIEEEVFGSMYDAIYKLPEQTRKIVLLTLEGVSNPKIAEQLKISVNTLKTLKKELINTSVMNLDHTGLLF